MKVLCEKQKGVTNKADSICHQNGKIKAWGPHERSCLIIKLQTYCTWWLREANKPQ